MATTKKRPSFQCRAASRARAIWLKKPMPEMVWNSRPLMVARSIRCGFGLVERGQRLLQIERHADIAGEQIERAERQYAERLVAADEGARGKIDAAVAAADDDGVVRAFPGGADRLDQLPAGKQAQFDLAPVLSQLTLDQRADRVRAAIEHRARVGIEEDQYSAHDHSGSQERAGRT